jgi:hypothetical protein
LTSVPGSGKVLGFASEKEGVLKKILTLGGVLALTCAAMACGSSPSASPTVPTTVAGTTPSPVPAPSPSPSPVVVATPAPEPTESPEINDNDKPVERVGAGVYYVQCDGEIVENSRSAREAPVGCAVRLDATAKDAEGVPTNPRYPVHWSYSDYDAIEERGSNPMGPVITGKWGHDQEIYVVVDGVRSNTFRVRFY